MYHSTIYNSPIGNLYIVFDNDNLIGLFFNEEKYFEHYDMTPSNEPTKSHTNVKKWLDRYFNSESPDINDLPILIKASPFYEMVWRLLMEIPYGKTTTYGKLAEKIASVKGISKMSARAVGHAIGQNPIAIIIPCHRVIGVNNQLTGFSGGIDIKIKLLGHEGIDTSILKKPKK